MNEYEEVNSLSQEILDKAEEMGIEDADHVARFMSTNEEGYVDEEFSNWLVNTMGYKHIDGDDSGEGEGEYCFTVFELKGRMYKAEYAYYSFDGHNYDDFFDTWQEVRPVKKEIISYE